MITPQRATRLSITEYQKKLSHHLASLPSESLPLTSPPTETIVVDSLALGRVVVQPIYSEIPLPPFANSQMDGYAVRVAEARGGGPLPITEAISAGSSVSALPIGYAAPIMTGAALPVGADAVIPIELCLPAGDFKTHRQHNEVAFVLSAFEKVAIPRYIRDAGSDLPIGGLLVDADTVLTVSAIGALISAGIFTIEVVAQPTVAVISTGAELVSLTATSGPLPEGKIYDANSLLLSAAIKEAGAIARSYIYPSDDPKGFAGLIAELSASHDFILTSGGVSKGDYEVVREVLLENSEFLAEFHSVAMQPGGPQGFAQWQRTPIFCFPGNPVSALVSFELFLRPRLRRLLRLPESRKVVEAVLAEEVSVPAGVTQIRRGVLDSVGTVRFIGGTGSHLLHAYAQASHLIFLENSILENSGSVAQLAAGTTVTTWKI